MVPESVARRDTCVDIEEVAHLKWEGCAWASETLGGMIATSSPLLSSLGCIDFLFRKIILVLNRDLKSFLLHGRV